MANNKPATQPFRLHRYPIGGVVPVPATMPMSTATLEPLITLPPPAYHENRRPGISSGEYEDDDVSPPNYHSSSLFPHYNPDGKHLLPPAVLVSTVAGGRGADVEVEVVIDRDVEAQRVAHTNADADAYIDAGAVPQQQQRELRRARVLRRAMRVVLIGGTVVVGGVYGMLFATTR